MTLDDQPPIYPTASLARLRQSRSTWSSNSKDFSRVTAVPKPDCTRGCKKAGVHLPQELDASHHLHPYNAVTRDPAFNFHYSTALGDMNSQDTGSRSYCHCCTTGRSGLYYSRTPYPNIDGSTMALAHRLQPLEDTDVRDAPRPGSGMGGANTTPASARLPGLKSTSSPPPSSAPAACRLVGLCDSRLMLPRLATPRLRVDSASRLKSSRVESQM
ncbi:hypothetical protein B0H13DRAFT_1930255 [Mycena leptocephala]|nr:hypothetical protein B0H13DRAFT_1930255 [Mycena leptocephala]